MRPPLIYFLLPLVNSYYVSNFKSRPLHQWSSSSINSNINDDESSSIPFEPIISPLPRLPGILTKPRQKNEFQSALEYNWITGSCAHKQIFEATETIQRIRFAGDLMAFGLSDGKIILIRMSTGEILDKYMGHASEATALYFDGVNLLSGGGDGLLNIYNVTYSTPRRLGTCLKQYTLHQGMITGVKLITNYINGKAVSTIVTCGADRKLTGIDKDTGVIKFTTVLGSNPVCMDVMNNYIALGMQDGRVLFFSGATGKQILQFQAHSNKVMSIHFVSDDVVITGGFDGTVRRWDITGDRADKPNPSRIIDFYFRDVLVNEYASDQFYSKESFIKDLPTGSFKIYKDTQGELSPVVSVQGDKEKIVAAYQDGDIRIWDTLTCSPWFEIRGRSSQITSIQYDATRLVADGSYSILIVHDFSAAAGEDALRVDQDDGSPTATG